MQYVSILSPGFSGSTLLSILLTSPPRSIGFGDTYFGRTNSIKALCTCGKPFLECEARLMIRNAVRQKGLEDFSWETVPAVPRPSSWPKSLARFWPLTQAASLPVLRRIPVGLRKRMFSRFYRENRYILESLEESGQYDYYIDGSKVPNRLELLRTAIPDIKVIHMIRHPGAILYHDQRAGISKVEYRLSQWSRYHRRARSFVPLVGESNYFAVPYESIVQDPKKFLERVGEFLGFDDWPPEDAVTIDRSKVHIVGNKMRQTAERIIDYSNTWRTHVPEQEKMMADEQILKTTWAMRVYDDWGCNLEMKRSN
jgi:hypothetical protein